MTSATNTADVSLVCCGLLGTLVADDGLIERSFAEAIATQGVVAGTSAFARRMSQVHQARGRAPGDVLRTLFPDNEPRAQAAELAFDRALPDAIGRSVLTPLPGAIEALGLLRAAGRLVCVLTSLARKVLDQVLDATDLRRHIDLALSREDAPRGFPAPDLALTAMLRAGVTGVRDAALVHGTGAGVACGRLAGASVVVGVLTGPHAAARLRSAGANYVIGSVAELPGLLASPRAAGGAVTGENGATAGRQDQTTQADVDVPAQVGERRRLDR